MPVFTVAPIAAPFNLDTFLAGLTVANITSVPSALSSQVVVDFAGGLRMFVVGNNLSVTNFGSEFAGDVTQVTFQSGNMNFATLTGSQMPFSSLIGNAASLFSGDDTINGNGSTPQPLYGYGGNDVLTMTDSSLQDADSLYGGEGDDRFQIDYVPGGFANNIGPNDAIFGGAGTDTLWLNVPNTATFAVLPPVPESVELLRITYNGNAGLIELNGNLGILGTAGLTGLESLSGITALASGTYDLSGLTWRGASFNGGFTNVSFAGSTGDDTFIAPSAYFDVGTIRYFGLAGNDTLTGNASGESSYGGAGLDRLTGGGGNDTMNGDEDADALFGGIGDDALYGDAGAANSGHANDTLTGGSGADVLSGAGGDDTYVADAADTIVEEAGAFTGVDTVQIAISASLRDYRNIENLTLIGTAAVDGAGNAGSNVITGNAGANYLTGGGGVDTLQGAGGSDTYLLELGVTVIEAVGAGTDTALTFATATLATNVERLILLGDSNINGTGNALANRITGNDGNNRIDGGAGVDRLIGAEGDDTYVFTAGDVIIEFDDEGTDTVESSVTVTLAAGVENLLLTGALVANGTGNTLANRLTGNTAANTLNGGEGVDTLVGGLGNDTYLVDNAADVVTELAGDTDDTVRASVDYVLVASANIETLAAAAGTVAIDLTGNALAQDIVGNGGANVINGLSGADTLTGGSGADTFVFSAALATTGTDTITDFSRALDIIHLQNSVFTTLTTSGALAATAFVANTTGLATDAADRIIYETDTGIIRYDSNGSAAGGTQVTFVRLQTPLALDHTDFLVM